MSDPAIISCPADSWTKIATNVTTGNVHRILKGPGSYLQTYRDTGNPAPTDLSDAVPIFESGSQVPISNISGIDIYIYPVGKAGSVRVDL